MRDLQTTRDKEIAQHLELQEKIQKNLDHERERNGEVLAELRAALEQEQQKAVHQHQGHEKALEELLRERREAGEQLEALEKERDQAVLHAQNARDRLEKVQIEADRQIERALASVERRAEEHNRDVLAELASFADRLSVELDHPRRIIKNFCTGLEDQLNAHLDDEAHQVLTRVRENSTRLEDVISDLRSISRSTQNQIEVEELDLSTLVQELAEILREKTPISATNLTIEPGLRASGDRAMIREALNAILSSAWQHTLTCDSPEIVFCAEEREGERVFCFRDNGEEINTEDTSDILALTRGGEKRSSSSPLALGKALRIVRRHGGRMWVEPSPDRGATVYFTLRGK